MVAKNETQTGLAAEIRIVPTWVRVLAGIVFVGTQVVFNVVLARLSDARDAWFLAFLGLLLGLVLGSATLLIGYISRDARRRGMSPLLWTIVAIVIPNALGIILYFILRQPLFNACPQCGTNVQMEFNFCPRCNHKLSPSCPQCQRAVGVNDVYCPYCGTSLRNQAAPASSPPTKLTG